MVKDKASFRAIKKALASHPDLEWDVCIEFDPTPIEGNALASGDDAEDRAQEQWIHDQLESGNEYAWCWVSLKVTWREFEANDSLGCVSCASKADFEKSFLADMKNDLLIRLASNISETRDSITTLILGGK